MHIEKKRNNKNKLGIWTILARSGIVLLTTLVMAVALLYFAMLEVAKGPSPTAQGLFVRSVTETSAIGFLASWFFEPEEIAAFVGSGRKTETSEVTDATLIQIGSEPNSDDSSGNRNPEDSGNEQQTAKEALSVVDISGSTYKGKLMMIQDPSRVFVGISGEYGAAFSGKTVQDMVSSYGAVAGTNAGGFSDPNGVGNGGIPLGLVISQGKLRYGSPSADYEIIGFDNNHILHVGNMTGQQALDAGMRDAVCFGPVLIVNGKAQNETADLGGGFNPRTAIGQTADGTVLLLVIDGRQANSLGATYDDLITVMQRYGAVNAANLDGGSSSHMIYNNELITVCSSLYGPRKMPTCILVGAE